MEKVIIHVRGGVAYINEQTSNVEVEIIDFDCLNAEEPEEDIATCAHCGKDFPESEVNMIDYDLDTCVSCEKELK